MNNNYFGDNVSFYRKRLDITQEDLAEEMSVSRQTVSRWENNSAFPDVETLIRLCELFDCDMDTLVRKDAKSCQGACDDECSLSLNKYQENAIKKNKVMEIANSIISSVAIIVFLILGIGFNLWHPAWIAFPIACVSCFLVSIICHFVFPLYNKNPPA